jgi:hypothetical protein
MTSKTFQWQFITFFRLLFAAHLLYSGGAYIFFGWVPSAMSNPASPVGQFMVELDKLGLYPLVKYLEFALGLLALSNRFIPLAAVMEFPITVMIAYLNIFVEGAIAPRHYYTGIQELVINGIVLLGYGAYYRSMLTLRSEPAWLWEQPGQTLPHQQLERNDAGALGGIPIWIFFVLFMAVVMAASWMLGSSARRLPPRDWLPPLLAFIGMLAAFRFKLGRAA